MGSMGTARAPTTHPAQKPPVQLAALAFEISPAAVCCCLCREWRVLLGVCVFVCSVVGRIHGRIKAELGKLPCFSLGFALGKATQTGT
jgi:hypothetical protein